MENTKASSIRQTVHCKKIIVYQLNWSHKLNIYIHIKSKVEMKRSKVIAPTEKVFLRGATQNLKRKTKI